MLVAYGPTHPKKIRAQKKNKKDLTNILIMVVYGICITLTERITMSKIRMNTEFRNKILNRYVESTENENTQEREAYLQAREKVDALYPQAFRL